MENGNKCEGCLAYRFARAEEFPHTGHLTICHKQQSGNTLDFAGPCDAGVWKAETQPLRSSACLGQHDHDLSDVRRNFPAVWLCRSFQDLTFNCHVGKKQQEGMPCARIDDLCLFLHIIWASEWCLKIAIYVPPVLCFAVYRRRSC